MKKRSPDGWLRTVDSKMKWYGETDLDKKVIRINKKKAKKPGELIDSIVHETYHKDHPGASEKETIRMTKILVKKMNAKKKQRLYNLFRG